MHDAVVSISSDSVFGKVINHEPLFASPTTMDLLMCIMHDNTPRTLTSSHTQIYE